MAYENFPEATEKAAKILAPVGKALAVPYEMAEKVVIFLDTATGQIISRKWNSLDPYAQNLIKGFGKIISVTYLAKEAGAILNISKELDAAKLAKIHKDSLPVNLLKNIQTIQASEANAPYIARGMKPPYDLDSQVRKFEIVSDTTFVRVSTPDNPMGAFLARESEISGMSAKEIQQHLALPYTPTQISTVNVPAGSKMQVGKIAAQPQFGTIYKGGFQYELLDQIPSSRFGKPRPLQ